jgi:hypothetical protein
MIYDDQKLQNESLFYTIENGNITEETAIYRFEDPNQETKVYQTHFYFTEDQSNTITNENIGMGFYGKSNKNALYKMILQYEIESYYYEYDQNIRMVKRITYNPAGTNTKNSVFVYQN